MGWSCWWQKKKKEKKEEASFCVLDLFEGV